MAFTLKHEAERAFSLYINFKRTQNLPVGEIIKFDGINGKDVYNPSAPFFLNGKEYIAGRVEDRDGNSSKAVFFQEESGCWRPVDGAQQFENFEDPFVAFIGDRFVLGGVNVHWDNGRIVSWNTDFFIGNALTNLRKISSGPMGMKDIRLLGLGDGRVAVFTRPQGQVMLDSYGCLASIGFSVTDSLESVDAKLISAAPLFHGIFRPEEWGGANQLHLLSNGLIGVIGHIAWGEMVGAIKYLHYYSMAFVVDPDTGERSSIKVIASRDCFPAGPAKRPELADVTFTSGIRRNFDGTAELYSGLSDCQAGRITIPDPFIEYEI